MITLDDALNRNYYFYQQSGDVRTDFLKQVVETFLGYNFNNFIGDKAKYWMSKGMTRSDAFTKAYHQGVEMAIRACEAIPKYRKEIIKKFNEQPGLRGGITDEQINHMKYTELSTLRTNLGLNKRGKKVVKQEAAPAKTVEQAKSALKKDSTSKTAADVIQNSQPTLQDMYPDAFVPTPPREQPHHEIEEFYTIEEAMQLYPGFSIEELAEVGVHLIGDLEQAKEKIDRYTIIEQILDFDITFNGESLTIEILADCNKEQLLQIYNTARVLHRVTSKRNTK